MMSCQISGFDSTIAETITARSGHARFTCAISRRFTSSGRSEISSTLLIASIFCPPKCHAPYRFETFNTGAPIVFPPAPPHPASNARCTCMPEFAGGADASQNGFGERIPAKLIRRSPIPHHPYVNGPSRQLSILNRHHRGCGSPSADTVATRINAGQTRLKTIIHLDVALYCFQVQTSRQRSLFLPNRLHHLVGGNHEMRAIHRARRGTSRGVSLSQTHPHAFDANHASLFLDNPHRLRSKLKSHASFRDETVLV